MKPCPVPACHRKFPLGRVMCRWCWARVPKELRDRVWGEYRRNPGGAAHLQAIAEAIGIATPATVPPA